MANPSARDILILIFSAEKITADEAQANPIILRISYRNRSILHSRSNPSGISSSAWLMCRKVPRMRKDAGVAQDTSDEYSSLT